MKSTINLPPASLPEEAADGVARALQEHGFAACRVGGAVRDRLLGKVPGEVDVATDAVPAAVRGIFPRSYAVGESFGVVVVHTDCGVDVEVATFRADGYYADGRHPVDVRFSDLPTDARRRDFTINGLYYDPVRHELYDHVGGLGDLRRGMVRAIGQADRRFEEDALRMLRAVRFAAALAFDLEAETLEAIRRHAGKIGKISAERIFSELSRMLTGPAPHRAVQGLSACGLLAEILPEAEAMRGVEQPPEFHPEGDVWVHTVLMLEQLRWPSLELAWSVLLHDVGKPVCHTYDGQRHRFNGHAEAGAEIARGILSRLKAPRQVTDAVCACIGGHMAFMNVTHMRRATFRRLAGRPTFPTELELHRLDCTGSHRLLDHYCFILDRIAEFANEPVLPPPFITGRDVLAAGVKRGPLVGRILAEVQEEQLEGNLASREDALALMARLVGNYAVSCPSMAHYPKYRGSP